MIGWLARGGTASGETRIRLELSGPQLTRSLARLAAGCEPQGGIERYVEALKLKGLSMRKKAKKNG